MSTRREFLLSILGASAVLALPAQAARRSLPTDLEQTLNFNPEPFRSPVFDIHPLPLEGISEQARVIAARKIKTTILELEEVGKRRKVNFLSFAKVCELGADGQPSKAHQQAVVQLFGRLVDQGVLQYGMLAPPSWLSLGHSCAYPMGPGCLFGAPCEKRAMLFFFAFPSWKWLAHNGLEPENCVGDWEQRIRDEINAIAGNSCFMREGEVGNRDWHGLICEGCGQAFGPEPVLDAEFLGSWRNVHTYPAVGCFPVDSNTWHRHRDVLRLQKTL